MGGRLHIIGCRSPGHPGGTYVYREELAPEHAEIEDQYAREASTRAAVVGSGRVGRTRLLSLEERAVLAARALIRHRHTSYEYDLVDEAIDDPWDEEYTYREIKAEAQLGVDQLLETHRNVPR